MKKFIYSLLAFTTLLIACQPKDNLGTIDKATLIGKWKIITQNDQTVLTDNRIVYTFNSDGTGTQTLSADPESVGERAWYMEQKLKYTLNGDALYTQWVNSSVVMEWLASVTELNDQQFVVDPSRVLVQTQPLTDMPQTVWQRVRADYKDDIIGLWEGTSCSGITYGDHHHQWLFLPSGQYFYYSPDSVDGQPIAGKWKISENTLNEYDIDGDYLAFRWKTNAQSTELREFWDIAFVQDKQMSWSALRQYANKQTYTASFTMDRVSPTQKEVEQYLPGKWVAYMIDDELIPTNEKSVHTFDGQGTVYYTIPDTLKKISQWLDRLALNYSLDGSYLVERGPDKSGKMVQWRSNLTEIDNSELLVYAFSSTRDTEGADKPYREIRLQKVDADYRQMIVCGKDSIWQGIDGTGGAYGSYDHLWEYMDANEKGVRNYIYYTKVNGKWQEDDDERGEYLVEGNWLATSWKENGNYMYEMWDIEIENDTMRWSGVRSDVLNTFKMVKVPKSTVGPFKE